MKCATEALGNRGGKWPEIDVQLSSLQGNEVPKTGIGILEDEDDSSISEFRFNGSSSMAERITFRAARGDQSSFFGP